MLVRHDAALMCCIRESNLKPSFFLLVTQCAKCKKAYYCSSKCFNSHLPVHTNFCDAKEITCDPKGTKLTLIKFDRPPILDLDSKNDDSTKQEDEVEESPIEEPVDVSEGEEKCVEEEVLEVDSDDEESVNSVPELMNDSFNSFGGRGSSSFNSFGSREEYTKEEVDLRHAELIKREYGWLTPDWVGSPLRPTPHGKLLKIKGDLASPVTDVQVLLEKAEIGWQKPEWTNAKLRKTPSGKQILEEVQDKGSIAEAPAL